MVEEQFFNLPFTYVDIDYQQIIDQAILETIKYLLEEKCYYIINDDNYLADAIVESVLPACKKILNLNSESDLDYINAVYIGVLEQILPWEWDYMKVGVKTYIRKFL